MRDLYRPDKKPKRELTKREMKMAYTRLCSAARHYIRRTTEKFFKNFQKKDRFQMAAKMKMVNSMPQQYNEAFIKRIKRLSNMAESKGYTVQFSKWRTTKEYNWHFVRETK